MTARPGSFYVSKNELTPRQLQILSLMARGNSQIEISKMLYITTDTVKHSAIAIRRKLNATNNIHAVYLAVKGGLLD